MAITGSLPLSKVMNTARMLCSRHLTSAAEYREDQRKSQNHMSHTKSTHLVAVVTRFDDGAGGDMGDAAGLAVDADGPVRIVSLLDVQHRQVLLLLSAILYIPGHWVAAAVHLEVQDVQPCSSRGTHQ